MARTLIEHVTAITLDDSLGEEAGAARVVTDASIAIDGETIVAVGAPPAGFEADETIDGFDRVALPAFFNAHCHSPMTLERGWAEDLPFDRWLNEKVWVAESALQEEDVYWGAALAACEMIRSGVAGFADHYFWMDQVAKVVEESGLKALLAWCFFGLGADKEVGGAGLERTRAFAQRWNGAAGGRIRTAMGPHSPYMCPPDALRAAAKAAGELGIPIHLHLSESPEQVATSLDRHGATPVAHLQALGVLDARVLAAHCNAVSAEDLRILAERRVTVAHTPKTYMKLAMAMPPLQAMLDAGVDVALGSDGPASNSDLNLLEVLRLTGLTQKQAQGRADAMPIATLLRLATRTGAEAMGFGSSGVLAAGAAADIALIDTRRPHFFPRHDVAAGVVYASHPGDVTHLWVDGHLLMREGALLTLDEERIRYEAERRAFRMVGRPMAVMRTYEG